MALALLAAAACTLLAFIGIVYSRHKVAGQYAHLAVDGAPLDAEASAVEPRR